jgi:hypothetical protein
METRSREEIIAGLRKPRAIEVLGARRAIIKVEGLRGRKLRKRLREVFEALRDASDDELVAIVDEAAASRADD